MKHANPFVVKHTESVSQRSLTSETMKTTVKEGFTSDDINYTFGLYKLLCHVMGLWPYDCDSVSARLIFTLACTTNATMIIFVLGEPILFGTAVNLQMLSYTLCNVLSLTKIIVIRSHRREIQEILDHLFAAWKSTTKTALMKIMISRAKLGRLVCIYQVGGTYMVVLPTIIGALPMFAPHINVTLNETSSIIRTFPLATNSMFAHTSSMSYAIIFIYQIVQLFYTVTGNVGLDVFFFGLALLVTAQLNCLETCLETIFENEQEIDGDIFSEVVGTHVKLLEITQYLEKTFNFAILGIVAINCSQICLYGIMMIRCARHHDFVLFTNGLVCIMILSAQIFIYSYAGECLSQSLANLGDGLYRSTWYEMSGHNRSSIALILLRTSRSFTLTAGKIYGMNLDSFKSNVKALGSYFSVMQAVFEE